MSHQAPGSCIFIFIHFNYLVASLLIMGYLGSNSFLSIGVFIDTLLLLILNVIPLCSQNVLCRISVLNFVETYFMICLGEFSIIYALEKNLPLLYICSISVKVFDGVFLIYISVDVGFLFSSISYQKRSVKTLLTMVVDLSISLFKSASFASCILKFSYQVHTRLLLCPSDELSPL